MGRQIQNTEMFENEAHSYFSNEIKTIDNDLNQIKTEYRQKEKQFMASTEQQKSKRELLKETTQDINFKIAETKKLIEANENTTEKQRQNSGTYQISINGLDKAYDKGKKTIKNVEEINGSLNILINELER